MLRALAVALVLSACSFTHGEAGSPGGGDAGNRIDAAVPRPDAAVLDAALLDGGPPPAPPLDCLDAYEHGITADGVVTIDPDGPGGNPPFDAYCDMTHAGGGWTLVWVYGFTDYAHFDHGDNAVTPRPTWGVPTTGTSTPTSTTVPTSPATPGALDFARWGDLGGNFLVESNINNWIECVPGTGSLVDKVDGTVTCTVIDASITGLCSTTAPAHLTFGTYGVALLVTTSAFSTYYYWEGSVSSQNWPTHDPCGMNMPDQVANAQNPYGALFLHR